jgi:hypothetical protein
VVGQLDRQFLRISHPQHSVRHETAQLVGGGSPPQVVASEDGEESAGVVVEPG